MNHVGVDGRSAWMLLDKFFSILADEVSDRSEPLAMLEWGKEAGRLPMAPYAVWDITQKGKPEPLPEPAAPPSPPDGFVSH